MNNWDFFFFNYEQYDSIVIRTHHWFCFYDNSWKSFKNSLEDRLFLLFSFFKLTISWLFFFSFCTHIWMDKEDRRTTNNILMFKKKSRPWVVKERKKKAICWWLRPSREFFFLLLYRHLIKCGIFFFIAHHRDKVPRSSSVDNLIKFFFLIKIFFRK